MQILLVMIIVLNKKMRPPINMDVYTTEKIIQNALELLISFIPYVDIHVTCILI